MYKRQLAGRALRTAVVRRAAVGAIFVRDVTVGIGLTGSTPVTGVAVSYTHLDVYKRQVGTQASFGGNPAIVGKGGK